MARVPWQFNGVEWSINPEKDSGFVREHVRPETVGINAQQSTFQYGGTKSGRRQISGWLFGANAATQYNLMRSWFNNRTRATLVDHTGASTTATMTKFDAELVISTTEWAQGRSTWRYNAEFTEG